MIIDNLLNSNLTVKEWQVNPSYAHSANGKLTVTKQGRVCILSVPIAFTGLPTAANTLIATLPEEFKALYGAQQQFPVSNIEGKVVSLSVNTAGEVYIYNYTGTTGLINTRMGLMYMSAT